MVKRRKTHRPEKIGHDREPEIQAEIEEMPEPVEVVEEPVEEVVPEQPKHRLCECGKPANPDSHQCWGCSHRS